MARAFCKTSRQYFYIDLVLNIDVQIKNLKQILKAYKTEWEFGFKINSLYSFYFIFITFEPPGLQYYQIWVKRMSHISWPIFNNFIQSL